MLYNLEAGVKSVYHVKHFTVCGQKGAIASPPHLTISCPVELLWSLEMSVGDDLETIKSDSDDALGKHNLIPAPGHVSPPPPLWRSDVALMSWDARQTQMGANWQ